MSPERWQKVEAIVFSALEIAPDKRESFLAKECADDAELREEVESLIGYDEKSEEFINAPAIAFAADLLPEEKLQDGNIGKQVGTYKIEKEINRGGMGTVYLAVRADDHYKKQVAIKILRRGVDTNDLRRHFRHERQILAGLDHPNIARLIDGGTTDDGLPYFVMEFVEGVPLDDYCDKKNLSTNERLKLFLAVCDAVSFAHRKLVVHRDIKPSNILVTSDGTPKLLDFGIAKLLDPERLQESQHTITNLRAMTPEYASPEQVRGQSVTTASDVYSLGVVLYELLCGHRPYYFDNRNSEEVFRAVCETEPALPSAVSGSKFKIQSSNLKTNPVKQHTSSNVREINPQSAIRNPQSLRGDLDNIVMKALKKEPERRYISVEQFSEDIRRYLEGLPVLARADTFGYRASKFIVRNRIAVAAVVIVFLSLTVGIVTTITQARRAERERARAEKRFNDVRKLANSFLDEISPAIENLPGSTPARELVVKRALEYLDSLAQESSNDPTLQKELAEAYEKVGDVQGYPGQPNLGDLRGAFESYKKARLIRETLLTADGKNIVNRDGLATNYEHTGLALWWASETEGAVENFKKGIAIREALINENPQNAGQKHKFADLKISFGDVFAWNGNTKEAKEYYGQALSLLNSLLMSQPENTSYKKSLARCYTRIGEALAWENDLKGGVKEIEKAIEILEPLVIENPNDTSFKSSLIVTYFRAGETLADIDTNSALEVFQKSLRLAEEMIKSDPTNSKAGYELGLAYYKVGSILQMRKDYAASLPYLQKAIDNQQRLIAVDSKNTGYKNSLANCVSEMGKSQMLMGNLTVSMENQQKALRLRESLSGEDPKDTSVQRDIAISYQDIGQLQIKMSRWREARESLQKSLDIFFKLQSQNALREYDKKEVESIKKSIEKCEKMLAKN